LKAFDHNLVPSREVYRDGDSDEADVQDDVAEQVGDSVYLALAVVLKLRRMFDALRE
jgi:hypothetical protein